MKRRRRSRGGCRLLQSVLSRLRGSKNSDDIDTQRDDIDHGSVAQIYTTASSLPAETK